MKKMQEEADNSQEDKDEDKKFVSLDRLVNPKI